VCVWIDCILKKNKTFFNLKDRMAFLRNISLFSSSTQPTTTTNDDTNNQETVSDD
jgi:hypothetical protein